MSAIHLTKYVEDFYEQKYKTMKKKRNRRPQNMEKYNLFISSYKKPNLNR